MRKGKCFNSVMALAAAALVLTGAGVKSASAYFTTYVSAGGSQVVHMGSQTEIHEEVSEMTKHISIENTSQTNDCYVRIKVFHGSQLDISYTDQSENGNLWRYSEADGYWYYEPILAPGGKTELLDARILLPEGFDQDSFNVVVIQECTPVVYDAQGNPMADWTTVYSEYQETIQQKEGEDPR